METLACSRANRTKKIAAPIVSTSKPPAKKNTLKPAKSPLPAREVLAVLPEAHRQLFLDHLALVADACLAAPKTPPQTA